MARAVTEQLGCVPTVHTDPDLVARGAVLALAAVGVDEPAPVPAVAAPLVVASPDSEADDADEAAVEELLVDEPVAEEPVAEEPARCGGAGSAEEPAVETAVENGSSKRPLRSTRCPRTPAPMHRPSSSPCR